MRSFDKFIIDDNIYEFHGNFNETSSYCFLINTDKGYLDYLEKLISSGIVVKNVKIFYRNKLLYESSKTWIMKRHHKSEAEFF